MSENTYELQMKIFVKAKTSKEALEFSEGLLTAVQSLDGVVEGGTVKDPKLVSGIETPEVGSFLDGEAAYRAAAVGSRVARRSGVDGVQILWLEKQSDGKWVTDTGVNYGFLDVKRQVLPPAGATK